MIKLLNALCAVILSQKEVMVRLRCRACEIYDRKDGNIVSNLETKPGKRVKKK